MASTSAPLDSPRAVRDEVRRLERDAGRDAEARTSKGDASLDVDDASSSPRRTTTRDPRATTTPPHPDTPPRSRERPLERDRVPPRDLPSTSRAPPPAAASSVDVVSKPSDDSTLEELRYAHPDSARAAAALPDATPPNAAPRAPGTGLDSIPVPRRERRALLLHPVPVETLRPLAPRVASRVPGGVLARRLRRRRVHEQTGHALFADDSKRERRPTRATRRRRAVHAGQKLQSERAKRSEARRIPEPRHKH
jgi:hypothetical protein